MRAPNNRRVDPRSLGQRAPGELFGVTELFPAPPKTPARKSLEVPEDWDDTETNPPPKAA